jgi:NDP-sugar pyrophosphorylase family protein
MALLPQVIPGESAVWHQDGMVVGIGKAAPAGTTATAGNFACVQVLTPAFLDLLPKEGVFDVIASGYQRCFARGLPVAAFEHRGVWHDLRTPAFYWAAVKDLAERPGATTAVGIDFCRGLRPQTSSIGAGVVRSGTVIIEAGCTVGAGAQLEDVLLLPGAVVPAGSRVRQRIVGPALSLPIT